MLKTKLIIKLKNLYNFNIGKCKEILEKNNWSFENSIKFIKNENIKKNLNNFLFNNILTFEDNNKIYIIKILYNSIIINNSKILENFKNSFFNYVNIIILKEKLKIFSIELNELVLLKNFFIFYKKNIFFYNHKNIFFCLINFKKKILNICCDIIFNKFNFIKNNNCIFNLPNKNYLKNNNFLLKKIIDFNLINFIFLINKKDVYFYYE